MSSDYTGISLENGLKDDYANVLTPLFGAGIVVSRCTIGIILLVFPRLGCLNVTIASFVISSLFSYLVTLYFQAIYQIVINIVYGYITGKRICFIYTSILTRDKPDINLEKKYTRNYFLSK